MRKPIPWLLVLDIAAGTAFMAAAAAVFFYAPLEAVMGAVQKVFYFHVSSAWAGMLGYLAAAVCGAAYLRTRRTAWDQIAAAAVEVGLVFTIIALVSGSIWGRATWNTWWTWDPRLTTTAIMALAYAAYLLLRQGVEDPEKKARFGAVYVIVAFISVPLTFFSIRFLRTIHPVLIGNGDPTGSGMFAMSAAMLHTFILSLAAFSLVFASLLWHRTRLEKRQARLEDARAEREA